MGFFEDTPITIMLLPLPFPRHTIGVFLTAIAVAAALTLGSCPPLVAATAHEAPLALDSWMGALLPFAGNLSLLQLCLPGTHDSATAHLSATVADGANDIPPAAAALLHDVGDLGGLGAFLRAQAATQRLGLVAQLDAGIRFIDLRVTFTAPPGVKSAATASYDWFCVHLVQSSRPALAYLADVRAWMDSHPTEVVVLWLSRHGSPCDNAFPTAPVAEQQELMRALLRLFGPLLFRGRLSEATLSGMVSGNQRVVLILSSFANMTGAGGADAALDACDSLDNQLGDHVADEIATQYFLRQTLANAEARKARDAATGKLFLLSMAASPPSRQMVDALLLQLLPPSTAAHRTIEQQCAGAFGIPNMTTCPPTLLAVSELTNFYQQRLLDAAADGQLGLPGAIYLDAVEREGVIALGGSGARFGYVAAVLSYNLRRAVRGVPGGCVGAGPACVALQRAIERMRAAAPVRLWNDTASGRLADWPPQS